MTSSSSNEPPDSVPDSPPSSAGGSEDSSSLRPPKGKSLLTHKRPSKEKKDGQAAAPRLRKGGREPELSGGDPDKLKKSSPAKTDSKSTEKARSDDEVSEEGATEDGVGENVRDAADNASPKKASRPSGPQGDETEPGAQSPDLKNTMRRIHKRKGDADQKSPRGKDGSGKAASSLPETMARLNRENRFQEKVDRVFREKPESEEASSADEASERAYVVDDPDPGIVQGLFHFIFLFGRFANGAQLAQPVSATLGFLMLCGLGMVVPLRPWLVPEFTSPFPIVDFSFMVRVLAMGLALGLTGYIVLSLLFNLAVWVRFGRVGILFGLRVVTGAMLPLALTQTVCLALGSSLAGEAFWRGASPAWFDFMRSFVMPLLWAWGGFRLAQAVVRMVRLPLAPASGFLMVMPLLFLGMTLPTHPVLHGWRHASFKNELAQVEALMDEGRLRPALDSVSAMDNRIPYRAENIRRRAHLLEIEILYRLGEPDRARAACSQLEFFSVPDSALFEMARGVNLYLYTDHTLREETLSEVEERKNRRAMRGARTLLSRAVDLDSDLAPPRKWLARYYLPARPEEALPHVRALFKLEDTVEHLRMYLNVLATLERPKEMWDAMLEVQLPPEKWPDDIVRMGIETADQLDKPQRARRLRTLLGESLPPQSTVE